MPLYIFFKGMLIKTNFFKNNIKYFYIHLHILFRIITTHTNPQYDYTILIVTPLFRGDKTDTSNISFAEATGAANGPPVLDFNFKRPQIILVLNLFWYQRPYFWS